MLTPFERKESLDFLCAVIERASSPRRDGPRLPAQQVAAHFGVDDFSPPQAKKEMQRAKRLIEGKVAVPPEWAVGATKPASGESGEQEMNPDAFPVDGERLVVGSQPENWARKIGGIRRILAGDGKVCDRESKIQALVDAGLVEVGCSWRGGEKYKPVGCPKEVAWER